jgi:very-short-patch-repair endonuclease
MRNQKLDQEDIEYLIDLLFDSKLTLIEISEIFEITLKELNDTLKSLGLGWVKSSKKKMSRGQTALTEIMKKLFPGVEIVNEFHIGERLRLDVYCPKYKIAAEFHGRQHFYYTGLYFDTKYEFEQAQKRDLRKVELCEEQGITLIVFRYNDLLTEEAVYNRLIEAIRSSEKEINVKTKKKITDSEFYKESKKKNSQYKKELYRKIKGSRPKNGN